MASPATPQRPQILLFRLNHVMRILSDYYGLPSTHSNKVLPLTPMAVTGPIDKVVATHFRKSKMLGSKDRAFVADAVYSFFRWKGLLEALAPTRTLFELLRTLLALDTTRMVSDSKYRGKFASLPPHVLVSFPEPLYSRISAAYGAAQGVDLCLALNTAAPVTIRANLLKTTREALAKSLQEGHGLATSHTTLSPLGLQFQKRLNVFELEEFTRGHFEMQDEASQLAAGLVLPARKDRVLDYCAGGGGKTLAFIHRLEGTGQVYLHDVRSAPLRNARVRLARAGATNVQFMEPGDKGLQLLRGSMDWVVADVPCSGTGALRRSPDQKWRVGEPQLAELVTKQREIFKEALGYMAPQGRIVYITCSVLAEENERQVAWFVQEHGLVIDGEVFKTLPSVGGMDGFFATRFRRRSSPP